MGDGDEIDTLYVNKYYEENVAGGANVTVSYYLGDRLIAQKNNGDLMYVHQDHLSGTSLMTDADGEPVGSVMKYYPFGSARSGETATDRLFTGQRYDDTGLYYYNARYYDPEIGRFISPDTIVPDPLNPQTYNRYSYCINNPLRYIDPSGHDLFDSQGNNIEDVDRLVWIAGFLAAYGYTNDTNLSQYITEEYMYVNEIRKIEQQQADTTNPLLAEPINPLSPQDMTISDYIESDDDWVVRSAKSTGMEIVEQQIIGPGGYWQFDVTCIMGIGVKGGAIYDGTGWHWYIGGGVGYEIGGGVSTSPNQLVTGWNEQADAYYGPLEVSWNYNDYTHNQGVSYGPTSIDLEDLDVGFRSGMAISTYYVFK